MEMFATGDILVKGRRVKALSENTTFQVQKNAANTGSLKASPSYRYLVFNIFFVMAFETNLKVKTIPYLESECISIQN